MARSLGLGDFNVLACDFFAFNLGCLAVFVLEEILPALEVVFDRPSAASNCRHDHLGRIVVTLNWVCLQLGAAHLIGRRARLPGLGRLKCHPLGVDRLLGLVGPCQQKDRASTPEAGQKSRQSAFIRFMADTLLIVGGPTGSRPRLAGRFTTGYATNQFVTCSDFKGSTVDAG